jgi:hypothetical protein
MKSINPNWKEERLKQIENREDIDITISFNPAAKWLITTLSHRNIAYKVINMGAGVKRITTITDVCPCCKRKL